MRGTLGLYKKPDGREEARVHFPRWILADGRELASVTIFPHPCNTCAGGDHTHVEMDDTREPEEILLRDAVELAPQHKEAIDRYLAEKIAVNELTLELLEYMGPHPHVHEHEH